MRSIISRSRAAGVALAAALGLNLAPGLPMHARQSQVLAVGSGTQATTTLAGAADLGPVAADTDLSLVLELQDPTATRQAADLKALYTRGSKSYGKFLTAAELASRYGPAPATVARLKSVLTGLGLSADWHQGNNWMVVSGKARLVEHAFGVSAHWYRSDRGVKYYAGLQEPQLPVALRPYVTHVSRLNSDLEPKQYAVPAGGLSPDNLLGAYDITPLRKLGIDGTGQTVVFFEFDGFAQTDLDTFTTKFNLPPIKPEIKAGPTLPAGGETEMDLEIVHEIAPGARLLLYYVDTQKFTQQNQTLAQQVQTLLDLQQKMIEENPGAILSQSWGVCEKPFGQALADAHKNLYDHADALGESSFVSTGDNAAYECLRIASRGTVPSADTLAVPLPAAVPGVTAVGGTRLSVSSTGSGWYNETVWEDPAATNGTGGGITSYFKRPTWQQGPGVVDAKYNPQGMRSIPDVSADGDPVSGASIFSSEGSSGGAWTAGGGTSQSAPIWAGIAALLNQYLQQKGLKPVGFMNPALYQIAAHPQAYTAFHDIQAGSNLYYPATKDYDMASGLGSPHVWNLARELETYQKGGGQ